MITINKFTNARLIPIIPTITFDCVVQCKPLKATLTHTDDHPFHVVYYIAFSDGYSSSFTGIEDKEGWMDDSGRKDYVKAIRSDLDALGFYSSNRALHCFLLEVKGKKTNVWVHQDNENKGAYDVYYSGDYRFTLEKVKGGFEAFSSRKIDYVAPDQTVAKQVGALLTTNQN